MQRIIHIFVLVAAIGVATPVLVTSAQTTSLEVTGSGKTTAIDGRYAGAADINIGGIARQAAVVATFVEPFSEEEPGGARAAMTTHTFDFGNGDSITTQERLVQAPTDDESRNSLYAELTVTIGDDAVLSNSAITP